MVFDRRELYLPNHEYQPQRILSNPRVNQSVGKGNIGRLLVFHPFLNILSLEDDVIERPIDLCGIRLESTLVQVLRQCLQELFLVVSNGPVQLA